MRSYAVGARLPVTDQLAREHLAIPISPVLDRLQAIEVVSAIREARA
jgi:dTDP-4-amino-4,6-dideoxygalactose transaminase